MQLWSKGLGRTEIYMDFRKYRAIRRGENRDTYIIGKMQEPVQWAFWIKFDPEDMLGILTLVFTRPILLWVFGKLIRLPFTIFSQKRVTPEHSSAELEEIVINTHTAINQEDGKRRRRLPVIIGQSEQAE